MLRVRAIGLRARVAEVVEADERGGSDIVYDLQHLGRDLIRERKCWEAIVQYAVGLHE